MSVVCAACGAENDAEQRFCGHCGEALIRTCPDCGQVARAGQRFCGNCGHSLQAAAAAQEVAAGDQRPTPELRWVSVLFVDLVGYTTLSESLDAEDVRELLSGYFATARRVVTRYGGQVEKFIGDAVVAVWGSPVAHDDDAERSVRAALEVVEAVAEYGRQHQLPGLAARAGVVTGQVASWSSDGEGMVAGDRVNTAARVQTAADPGSVLVDEATRLASRAAVTFQPAGEHVLKGKADPLSLWRAMGITAGVGGSPRIDGLEGRMVGRTRELALLKDLFHGCAEGGRARLVTVTGIAGVGKSRLGREFERYVDGLPANVLCHRGRCLSYGEGVAFWALAEIVRQRFGIAEDAPSDVAAVKLSERLPTWVPDGGERQFVAPRLGVLVGAFRGDLSREELFAGWRLFLEKLTAVGTVVLIIEDAQWADAGLVDFIDYLLDWSADFPLFVLLFARPELAERFPGWLSGRGNVTNLRLEPLAAPVIAELLNELVPGMPPTATERVAAQAEGVPLFAVELIRSLIDRDVVVPQGGTYQLVAELGNLDIPASLTSLIAARLDGLPVVEREAVKALAVLGTSFARRAAPAVVTGPEADIDRLLRALVRKEILTARHDPLSPEGGTYAFTQNVLRRIAYQTMTKRERRDRHLEVAAYLRRAFPDDGAEVAEVIAAHYQEAFTAMPAHPDAETVREQAVQAFERAARRAVEVGAPEAAETAYRTAARLAVGETDQLRFTAAAGDMAVRAGRHEDALVLYEEVARAHRAADRPQRAAALAHGIGHALGRLGRTEESAQRMREALDTLREHPDGEVEARLHCDLAFFLARPRTDEALEHAEQALALAEALELPEQLGTALQTKGTILGQRGRVVEATALLTAAVRYAEENGLTWAESVARVNLGDLLYQSDLPGAEEHTQGAADLLHRLGDRDEAFALGNLALIQFYAGKWESSQRNAERAVEIARGQAAQTLGSLALGVLLDARGDRYGLQAQLARLADSAAGSEDIQERCSHGVIKASAMLAEGRPDEALQAARGTVHDAYPVLRMRNDGIRLGWPLALEAALAAGDLDAADQLLAMVTDAPRGHVPPYLWAQQAHYRALTRAARADSTDVETDLRHAIEALHGLGYPYWTARTQADLGRWLAAQGRTDDAEPLLTESVSTFSRLGAELDLQKTQPLISATPA